MMDKLRFILHVLFIAAFVGLVSIIIVKPAWCLPYVEIIAIIAITLLVIEILIYNFCTIVNRLLPFCKTEMLRWAEIIADKLDQYSKRLQALQSKQESLDLLSPQIVENQSMCLY